MIILGHHLKQMEDDKWYYFCINCNIKYVHYKDYNNFKLPPRWTYIQSPIIGTVYLKITCKEQIIKNLLE